MIRRALRSTLPSPLASAAIDSWLHASFTLTTESQPLITVASILARAISQLGDSPDLCDTAARDALALLLHAAGITRAQFYANPDREISSEQRSAYEAAIARRLKSEPIQYITGEQEFYGLALQVTPAVLVPRPETEHLVEAALAELKSISAPRILDVGTGSGAIAIALAHHLPQAQVMATDISPEALAVARENTTRHGLTDRIEFIESDLFASVASEFDAVISNPPYVREADRATLHPQVRDYEPSCALFAGKDGLGIYRRLIPRARAALVPNGLIAMEIGHGQRDAIVQLLSGWNAVRFVDDLQGIPRVALARRP